MARDCAVILTAYNRPRLVSAAIESVLSQDCSRWRLFVMDDGSDATTRDSIARALVAEHVEVACDADLSAFRSDAPVVWYRGPDRTLPQRRGTISYSRSINICLTYLLHEDCQYVTYLCDDDVFYPESVLCRARYLDTNPQAHVVFGRLRVLKYGRDGSYNCWSTPQGPVTQVNQYHPHPAGQRILTKNGAAAKTAFVDGNVDPETLLPYVEEGFWQLGPQPYGNPYRADHNQIMHRGECLSACRPWQHATLGYDDSIARVQYWFEDRGRVYGSIGDAAFFESLASVPGHEFYGVDCWCVSKRYHSHSDGLVTGPERE